MRLVVIGLVGVVAAAVGGPAAAQPAGGGPPPRPAVSPYLNLLNRNNPAVVNYYGLVRPQMATGSALQSLQQGVATAQETAARGPGSDLPVTGQTVWFLNTGGYFLNLGAAGPGRAGSPAAASNRPAARPQPPRPR